MNCACPRGCSPPSEDERLNVRKWSENIQNLLMHPQGKDRFHAYLEQLDLEEDIYNLEFWDMALELEKLANNILDKHKRSIDLTDGSQRNVYNARSNTFINYARENINLDLQQLMELEKIKNDPEQCVVLLPRVKETLCSLLKDSYDQFIKQQLKTRLYLSSNSDREKS